MIRVTCTCGKRFRGPDAARGRTIRCTGCGRSIAVPADTPATEGARGPASAAQAMASRVGAAAAERTTFGELWSALRKRALHLDFVPPQEHLRRCMRCSLTTFDVPKPCPKCGAATIGVRLADVNSGRDRSWLVAVGAIAAARRRLSLFRRCALLVAVLAAAGTGAWLAARGALTGRIVFGLGVAAALAGALASYAALLLARRALEVLHPVLRGSASPDTADERLVAQVEERYLIPFIQRHSGFSQTADLIPADEIDLLLTLVARQGFTLRREHIYEFLAACALRADYQEFKAEFLRFELSNPDTFDVYASLFPSADADASRLPFLQQYLDEGARRPETQALWARIEGIRKEKRLATFEAELEKSAPASKSVRLEDVDRVAPANFQLLVGLMYQAEGHVVHGMTSTVDRPAVSVAEKTGEKTAVLAKLSKEPVGEGVVRDLAEARDYYRCRKAVLVANAEFSQAAAKAASEKDVHLAGREELRKMIDVFNAAPREFARLTLILQPWAPGVDEELMSFEFNEALQPRSASEKMSFDAADDMIAQLKKRAKAREEAEGE
ncbi:MAG: restriction endonuclease [Planctomycetes bacterium]|nr:restriction endonuclease [Planctomycetota bacterium]